MLENTTDPLLYRFEINEAGINCISIAIFDDSGGGGKMGDYSRKVCNLDGKLLKMNWDKNNNSSR